MNISARMDTLIPPKTRSLLRALGGLASKNGFKIYLVGGIVRDLLLNRENLDIDIAVDGDGQSFAVLVAETMNGSVVMHGRFGTSVVILPGKVRVDVATARTETYSRPGALPDVAFAAIQYDLNRRDFSINAMAVSLNTTDFGDLKDDFGGQADLGAGIIRSLYPESFIDDPTRILRAVRFESGLGFGLDPGTEERLRLAVKGGYLGRVSGSRLRKEIFAIADGPSPGQAMKRLGELGVWEAMVPGLAPPALAYRGINELKRAEEALAAHLKPGYKRRFAVLGALLKDSGRNAAGAFCSIIDISRFRASRISDFSESGAGKAAELKGVPSPGPLYASLRDTPEDFLVVLWAAGGTETRAAVERFMSLRETKPLITGRDLIRWGFPPSKAYADVLSAVFTMQLEGAVKTKAEAKTEARKGIIGYSKLA